MISALLIGYFIGLFVGWISMFSIMRAWINKYYQKR